MSKVFAVLGALALFISLTLLASVPKLPNIAVIGLMALSLLMLSIDRGGRAIAGQPMFLMVCTSGLLLFAALLPTATSAEHVLSILILTPLWLAGPYAALLAHAPARLLSPISIGLLALVGTAATSALAGFDVYFRGMTRGGFIVNNPIHLADLAIGLGFLSLVGMFGSSKFRFTVLSGPAFALATIVLSGSRGPLLAFAPMAVIAIVYLAFFVVSPPKAVLAMAGIFLAAMLLISPFITVNLGSRDFRLIDFVQAVQTGTDLDSSDAERLQMIRNAWRALQASPLFGHGMVDYQAKAAAFAPPGSPPINMEHLHNDFANFSVIGGALGLLSYLLILAAPLVGGVLAQGPRRPELIFIGLMASSGYLLMGLTNAMIGILTQTILYAVMLALVGALGVQETKSDHEEASPGEQP